MLSKSSRCARVRTNWKAMKAISEAFSAGERSSVRRSSTALYARQHHDLDPAHRLLETRAFVSSTEVVEFSV